MKEDLIDLRRLEIQLKKCYPNLRNWERRQNNEWDRCTRFIYQIRHFQTLENKIREEFLGLKTSTDNTKEFQSFRTYALHRWYNFWSAKGIEHIFCSQTNVKAHSDPYHKYIDFWIDEIPFDHKTSVFPKKYPQSVEFAKSNPTDLLSWLYRNQSKEQRFHLHNRLFLVLCDKEGKHQRLKSEIKFIKPIIEKYLQNFFRKQLKKLTFLGSEGKQRVLCDCIFIEN